MTTLVFSYCHADETLRNELEKHLAPLKRQGLIEAWHDRRIVPGQEFMGEIDRHFANADIVLLLVSPDFINSDYCYDIEMTQSVERHNKGKAVVIPVILRPCHWHNLPFGKLLAATPDGKPVTQFSTLDDGFYQVVDAIKRALQELHRSKPASPHVVIAAPTAIPAQLAASTATSARSSNLRIKKTFSDHERDNVRTECFEFIARYFANSLDELKQRNPEIEVNFQRIDAKSFEAKIYVDGNRKCSCGIWVGGTLFGGDIAFSHNGITQGSFNESMSIQDDGYSLGFKALGMASHGKAKNDFLNFEGVAEYFWEMLIQTLQQ